MPDRTGNGGVWHLCSLCGRREHGTASCEAVAALHRIIVELDAAKPGSNVESVIWNIAQGALKSGHRAGTHERSVNQDITDLEALAVLREIPGLLEDPEVEWRVVEAVARLSTPKEPHLTDEQWLVEERVRRQKARDDISKESINEKATRARNLVLQGRVDEAKAVWSKETNDELD